MTLPLSGTLGMNDIRSELGIPNQAPLSLESASLGQYIPINFNGIYYPRQTPPYAITDWYGYNHIASATPSITPSLTPSISISKTPSITPTVTPSISISATPSITPSISISATPSITPSISISATPSITPSISISATPSITPSITPSTSLVAQNAFVKVWLQTTVIDTYNDYTSQANSNNTNDIPGPANIVGTP